MGRINLLKDVFNITKFRPEDYIRSQLYFDSVLYREEEINFLINTVDIDRVVFGIDHPFTVSDIKNFYYLLKNTVGRY